MIYRLDTMQPEEIEKRSFEIIESELKRPLPEDIKPIVFRAIHTSADFDYAENLVFSPNAVKQGLDALKNGSRIVTDTNMALAGINKTALKTLGLEAFCFVADPAVASIAKDKGITRSSAAVDLAVQKYGDNLFFVCGNAPTALIRLHEMISECETVPKFVVGVPVGFVNVVQSKEMIIELGNRIHYPYIVARGRKGGSNIAASIVNALMYLLTR